MNRTTEKNSELLAIAIDYIYQAFPNLSYRPRPDDVKLLAAFLQSQNPDSPACLGELMNSSYNAIDIEINKFHSRQGKHNQSIPAFS
ncbi:hypothetical protein L6J37_05685 [Photobacterium sp. WH77]|uniref:hypothetical protein n=1 Tax=unclassified Photobacterium TaxID=2628852 RepID=UPI001EDAFE88|nr:MULTISPECIES: hypothetical protein [unclassified Photobacterium]MCG2836354.1 hypothetical protein [Photobacterium sp. WH77]MCG2844019.1 hypothetical protein [Photobacterium sp. WH80]MDO6580445.1 hypothetical protein [Photobacterium sp. 2_MG-2023]